MKCENCGKNEVTFVYQSNINGHVEEKHLCSECAEKLGYTQRINAHSQRMMQNFFGRGSLFGSSFFNDFFSPSLMGRMLDDPFDDFFADMPALSAAPARQQETKKEEDLVEKEEQSRFSYLRQLNALKVEMKKAVHQENFERAAELRDQIHKLEADHKEQKSGE
ncbi:UvrB/UvrC motif-containing protein [Pusillibacter faecalis]|uniref:UvrB/UvrC motif-containing protein n=1 Tax=Pusillibacter faecalis TaxID=2714358 RepID=UPI0029435648|nr:UvrB/UvrC motif-containing protein [Pusillibacter faecalis]